ALRDDGKVRHIGLSQVSVAELEQARAIATIASVQNLFNLTDRSSEPLLDRVAQLGIAFIPWFPLATGALARPGGRLATLAAVRGVTASQLALAWLLQRSPVMLPIPGTSRVAHVEENIAAAAVLLTPDEQRTLGESTARPGARLRSFARRAVRRSS
ncbi:MAG: aldo/keto reductase, partial [Ilumatobacteraceae bacterium]|nr:aldo/keto reductase [Ilumatobacteraceae bacterium]